MITGFPVSIELLILKHYAEILYKLFLKNKHIEMYNIQAFIKYSKLFLIRKSLTVEGAIGDFGIYVAF